MDEGIRGGLALVFALVATWGCDPGPEAADAPATPALDAGLVDAAGPGSPSTDAAAPEPGPDAGPPPPLRRCNGFAELCDRPYDQVVFAATHNAHASTADGFSVNANQDRTLTEQLEAGVRAMLLDVYDDRGVVHLCHGSCIFGKRNHADALREILAFLEREPNEVLTFIYEDHVPAAAVAADFEATGMLDLVYAHPPGQPWPTLGDMLDAGTRLVVSAESAGPPPAWFHHVWDIAWDTPYSYMSPDEFSCRLNRGNTDNDLFLLNHWVNTRGNLPSRANAEQVNQYDVLLGRAMDCWQQSGRLPNFVAVDFAAKGDLVDVVDTLNGTRPPGRIFGGTGAAD